ncbi:MAG: ISKra4 family transposase [Actinomycetospora chiangmaiensis]|nr:ISKra4 family transposase [Actinomycetospora chiangmaiensis]
MAISESSLLRGDRHVSAPDRGPQRQRGRCRRAGPAHGPRVGRDGRCRPRRPRHRRRRAGRRRSGPAIHPRPPPGRPQPPGRGPGEKGGSGWACPCGGARRHRGRAERRLLTAAGEVTLRRVYFTCRACGAHAHALDERLGVHGLLTPNAQRLLCLVGVDQSFEKAARKLRDLAGLVVCDNTVRKACDAHGGLARAWQRDDPEAARAFAEAKGDVEFQTDGTSVNTTGGWREIRLSIFAKRGRGEPTTDPDNWPGERLPSPTARFAAAGIRTGEALGPQWRRMAARLGIKQTSSITTLADGARWIWNQAGRSLPGCEGVLDFYHLVEHVSAAAAGLHGEGTAGAEEWSGRVRRDLLRSGGAATLAGLVAGPDRVDELVAYLGPHAGHTDYPRRLREGRSIGSGMVEGSCKTAIGLRLKQTGARWRVRRVERMASLCCLDYSDLWDAYWKKATA